MIMAQNLSLCYNINMKFFRVNDKTLKCMIPVKDLEENGITPEDIVSQKKEALDFLRSVIMKGAREVGISAEEKFTTFQLAIVNQNMLVMLASRGDCRKEIENFWKDLNSDMVANFYPREKQAPKQDKDIRRESIALKASSLYELLEFTRLLPLPESAGILSSLYRDEKKKEYILLLELPFPFISFSALFSLYGEFAEFKVLYQPATAFVKEHLTCIAPDSALENLRFISQSENA